MNGFLSTAPIPAEMINHSHSSERLTPFFRTPISNSFYSHKAISPISSENNRSRLLKPSKFNYSYSFHHFFILQRTSNPSAIPRFHVSSLQLSSFLQFLSISYWIMERLQHGVLQNIAKFLSLRNRLLPIQLIL